MAGSLGGGGQVNFAGQAKLTHHIFRSSEIGVAGRRPNGLLVSGFCPLIRGLRDFPLAVVEKQAGEREEPQEKQEEEPEVVVDFPVPRFERQEFFRAANPANE